MLDQVASRQPVHKQLGMVPAPVSQMPQRIVALGGGTGLSVLLQGLRTVCFPAGTWIPGREQDRDRLTAIVTAADDGGSSGILRQMFRILAPGDIRNCLLALSDAEPTLQALFNYRFDGKFGGHSLGNLMLTALTLLEQDFTKGIERASELLAVRGRVLPATFDDVNLLAEFLDGSCAVGESSISASRRPIHRVYLAPAGARALPQAIAAISASDLVVIGPGSLYTSLIPTLLVQDIARTIVQSRVPVVLVMNLMTEPGETDGYTAIDVLTAIQDHVPELQIDSVLLNTSPIPEYFAHSRAAKGTTPIIADPGAIRSLGYRTAQCELLDESHMIRHEPRKLAQALLNLVTC